MFFFKKNKKEASQVTDNFEAKSQQDWMRGELEFHHQPQNHQIRANPDSNVTLGRLLKIFDISKDEIGDMYIVSKDDEMQEKLIQDLEQVWDYDLSSTVLEINQREVSEKYAEHVILNIEYKRKQNESDSSNIFYKKDRGTNDLLIVHLRINGGNIASSNFGKKTFYICATICFPPSAYDKQIIPINDYLRLQGKAVSITFAYDMRHSEKKLEEYRYIKEDAFDKINNNRINELSEIQEFLINNILENVGKDFYFGKKLLEKSCFGSAIEYFMNVYVYLNSRWLTHALSDEEKYYFFETCYNLGFCYCELKKYEKALYYLDIIYSINNVRFKIEYINCLSNKKDFRTYNIIENELDRLKKIRYSEWTEEHHYYHKFLIRRLAYICIEMERFDDAEKILKDMLEIKENEDFAINELAYIQNLRKQQA